MRLRRVMWNLWQSNLKLKFMKNQSFEVLCHKQIRNARRGSKEKFSMKQFFMTVISATFGALPRVQIMHSICGFEAQEVKNPMLQTVHDSELKWRSYSHWNPITPSWRKNFARLRNHPFAAKWFRSHFYTVLWNASWIFPDICDTLEAEHHKLKANFAALRNHPFVAKWFCSRATIFIQLGVIGFQRL